MSNTTKPALPEPDEWACVLGVSQGIWTEPTVRAAIAAAVAEARAALIKAAAAFRLYEQLQLAKGTAESTTKAATNAELAGICEAALSATPSPTQPAEPVETVPWPVVTRYSGGASHEGIGGRVWIRLADDGPEVEYVPAPPARVAMSDEQIGAVEIDYAGMGIRGVLVEPEALIAYARAVIAEYERINGIAPAAPNGQAQGPSPAR